MKKSNFSHYTVLVILIGTSILFFSLPSCGKSKEELQKDKLDSITVIIDSISNTPKNRISDSLKISLDAYLKNN